VEKTTSWAASLALTASTSAVGRSLTKADASLLSSTPFHAAANAFTSIAGCATNNASTATGTAK
jgi:hypothetical protein